MLKKTTLAIVMIAIAILGGCTDKQQAQVDYIEERVRNDNFIVRAESVPNQFWDGMWNHYVYVQYRGDGNDVITGFQANRGNCTVTQPQTTLQPKYGDQYKLEMKGCTSQTLLSFTVITENGEVEYTF